MVTGIAALLMVGTAMFGVALMMWIDKWSMDDEDVYEPAVVDEVSSNDPFSAPKNHTSGVRPRMKLNSELGLGYDISSAFDRAWSAIQRLPGTFWIAGFLMGIADCSSNGNNSDSGDSSDAFASLSQDAGGVALLQSDLDGLLDNPAFLVGIFAATLLCLGLQVGFRAWLVPGLIRLNARTLRHHDGGFSELFSGLDRTAAMFGWRVLRMVLLAVPASVLLVPVTVVAVGAGMSGEDVEALVFQVDVVALAVVATAIALALWVYMAPTTLLAELFLVIDGHDPLTAYRLSARAAQGNRLTLIFFSILTSIVHITGILIGLLMLCVGVFVTMPLSRALYELMWVSAFLAARHGGDNVQVLSEPDPAL